MHEKSLKGHANLNSGLGRQLRWGGGLKRLEEGGGSRGGPFEQGRRQSHKEAGYGLREGRHEEEKRIWAQKT